MLPSLTGLPMRNEGKVPRTEEVIRGLWDGKPLGPPLGTRNKGKYVARMAAMGHPPGPDVCTGTHEGMRMEESVVKSGGQ